jgi:hypothetical protein
MFGMDAAAGVEPVRERRPMTERWINKLTVFGTQKELTKFLKSNWKKDLRGRYWELQETMRTRFGCLFETESSPLQSLEALSRRRPGLVYVWSWENETKRRMGLAKAKAGRVEQFEVRY